jgi:2-oxoglutarate ferredoxin oxidoreductase subunit alpha
VGWGSTCGALHQAAQRAQEEDLAVAHAHLRYLNPLPRNLPEILGQYRFILVPELNGGQLGLLLRGTFGMPNIVTLPKTQGRPFTIGEIRRAIDTLLTDDESPGDSAEG